MLHSSNSNDIYDETNACFYLPHTRFVFSTVLIAIRRWCVYDTRNYNRHDIINNNCCGLYGADRLEMLSTRDDSRSIPKNCPKSDFGEFSSLEFRKIMEITLESYICNSYDFRN